MTTTSTFRPRRPSPSARFAFGLTRLTVRPLEHVIPDNALGIRMTRGVLASMMAAAGHRAPDTRVERVRTHTDDGRRIVGEWVRPTGSQAATTSSAGVVLYIHGSAYVACSTRTHQPLVTQIASTTGLPVFSTEYRLAPRHVFPAAADDVGAAYAWLIEQGWAADQIVVMGDSAGGHLALDLSLSETRAGRPAPAGLALLSPLIDVTLARSAQQEKHRRDPMTSAAAARRLVAHYLGDADPDDPRLTHRVTRDDVLPPTLIQVGGAEMLRADSVHLAQMLTAGGHEVTLEIWPGQMHVFQAAGRLVPEAGVAIARASRFVQECLVGAAVGGLEATA